MSHSHPPPSSQGSTKPKQDLVQIDNSGLEAKVDIENSVSASGEHRIYVSWEGPDDPANPRNWDARKKWLLSSIGFGFSALGSLSVSAYSITVPSMQEELKTSRLLVIAGLSLFTFLFGAVPLVVAPLSEIYGRRTFYIASAVMFSVFHIPQALATNVETLLISRTLSAVGGASAIVLVGGTMSDLFANEDRGMPMTFFTLTAFLSTGLGPLSFGYLVQSHGFRPVVWIQFGLAAAFTIVLILVTQETRESVLLSRKANYLNKQSVGARYIVRLNEQRASLATIMKISLTRPFFLFFTEPTLQAFTAIISFAWADLYLLLVSVPMVFKEVYGFSVGQTGLAFSIFIISTCVAGAVARYTNRLYLANVESKGPEARMYTGVLGGLLLPLGCWIWAWTTFPSIHWILPTIGLGISYTGIFFLYLTVFNYLSDCYTLYASSALAAMNFWRNISAASFPLFTDSLYARMGIHGASTFVAGIATILAIIPFVAFRYGQRLRAKSRFAKTMADIKRKVEASRVANEP